jgi:hypothetical protein
MKINKYVDSRRRISGMLSVIDHFYRTLIHLGLTKHYSHTFDHFVNFCLRNLEGL